MMIQEKLAAQFFFICSIFSVLATILIFGFILFLGLPILQENNLLQILTQPWSPDTNAFGIYPMIVGTACVAALSIVFAFPLSLGCAALISILDRGLFSCIMRKTVQLMTGVPTVIYGFIGIFLLVPIIRELFEKGSGMCVLAASIMLAVLVAPTMILFFAGSFDNVPLSYLYAANSLGSTKVQNLLHVIFPCSWRGIVTGVILATGRAFGDTMIALMIAGNAVHIPGSFLDSARTLTSHIALISAADYESIEVRVIFACGLVLYCTTTFLVLFIRFLEFLSKRKLP